MGGEACHLNTGGGYAGLVTSPASPPNSVPSGVWIWVPIIQNPDVSAALAQINAKLSNLEQTMATLNEAVQAWVDFGKALQAENADLRAALETAQNSAQANADALAQFQADDAATDASQLVAKEQADADVLTAALDALKNPPTEPPPVDPGDGGGEPPVEPPVDPTV